MPKLLLFPVVVPFALLLADGCYAQSELVKRIKAVQEVPIWQRPQRTTAEMRQLLKELDSSGMDKMRNAIEAIALTRPDPAATDVVVKQTGEVARRTRDKFATAMAFEIKGDWSEAKKAAETLRLAQRSGGLRYLQQRIVRGNAAQAGGALIAAAYSGNVQATRLVAQYWAKSKIPGKRAVLIIGPKIAPDLAKQLAGGNRSVQMEVAALLGKVGTKKEVSLLRSAAEKADPNLRKRINSAIHEIEGRLAKEEARKRR